MIEVLDKGFVRLIHWMGSDIDIVRAARCSYDAAWRAGENEGSDHRLINYLMKNDHTTPFETVEFRFEIKAPIFVMRQWRTHRTWSYWSINELSARYKELPNEFYIPSVETIGKQSKDNKQGREINNEITDEERKKLEQQIYLYSLSCENIFSLYKHLLNDGWPRELARIVLPLSVYTHLFAKVDLHNLLHFLDLRTHIHAQWEIRQYANAILELITPIVPVSIDAWKKKTQTEDK
jgi:thymidylate synthase (FAD)